MTAREVSKALGGQWYGSYGTARCPAHDDTNPSLSITERGGKLLTNCHAGCDPESVWRGMQDRGAVDGDRGGILQTRNNNLASRDSGRATYSDNSDRALSIWRTSRPADETPVAAYLKARGITIPPPPTLRYHPALKHGPTGLLLPAMIAAVTAWPSREVTAIHRTFLRLDGQDKAPVTQAKMMLGPCAGGAVRLAPADDELVLAEGIETALSVFQSSGKLVWACLSTSGLKSVLLPPEVKTIIIAADGDEPGEKAAEEAAGRLYREGREVKIAKPPLGMDFNDLLMLPENVIPFPGHREAAHG